MTEYIVYRKVEDDQEPKPGSFSWEKVDHPEAVGFTGEDTVYRLKSPEGSEGAVVLMTPTKQIPDTVTSAATALKELLTVVEKAKEIDGSCGAEVTDAAVGAFVNTAKMPKILVDQLRIWRALAAVGAAAVLAALGVGIWLIVKLIDKVPENQLTGASMMGIIFVLALFIISPGVLFLLERPLKGIDGANLGLPTDKDGGDGAGGKDGKGDAGEG